MVAINIKNAKHMAISLIDSQIKNEHMHIGIMCVIAKECGFELVRELGYGNTSAERIREIFRSRTKDLSDDDINVLKSSDVNFFNHVYGGRIGNNWENDGYKFRGMGWPQLTGRGNLKRYCPEWIHIGALPMMLQIHPTTAAEVAVRFFKVGLLKRTILTMRYGRADNDETAIKWAANIAAGLGRGKNSTVIKRATENASVYNEEMRRIYEEIIYSKGG